MRSNGLEKAHRLASLCQACSRQDLTSTNMLAWQKGDRCTSTGHPICSSRSASFGRCQIHDEVIWRYLCTYRLACQTSKRRPASNPLGTTLSAAEAQNKRPKRTESCGHCTFYWTAALGSPPTLKMFQRGPPTLSMAVLYLRHSLVVEHEGVRGLPVCAMLQVRKPLWQSALSFCRRLGSRADHVAGLPGRSS